ncbi:MAG: hypothetical protein KUG83_07685 [Gammaproteobacteria bacterium]|nr:hypothetical protein [Gammaproteobacteria bacterium]
MSGQDRVPVIIDVEASGFGRGSYPIEIGVALNDHTTHCYLIKPEPEWTHWDKKAESLHGISKELLEDKGRSVGEVAECLNEILVGQLVYSDAWGFDSSWIGKLYDAAELIQGFRVETLRKILTESQLDTWDATKESVREELALQRHRASSDALLIQTIFERTSAFSSGAS